MPKVYVDNSTLLERNEDNILTCIFKPEKSDVKLLYIFDRYWIVNFVGHNAVLDIHFMKINTKIHGGE
jgi:hypothetical protein